MGILVQERDSVNDIVLAIATRRWEGWIKCVNSWYRTAVYPCSSRIIYDMNVVQAYQQAYETTTQPIIAMIHDDVEISELGWDERVMRQFDDPKVGLVGFAGALGHGRPEMYTAPFDIANMVRLHFMSNMRTAEQHGHRFTGECDAAVLDGLALIVRRSVLDKCGGWPVAAPYGFWMYGEWLCCETRRQGYKIRLVGVACDHLGGKTSSMSNVQDDYYLAHHYFWEHNADVMPYEVNR